MLILAALLVVAFGFQKAAEPVAAAHVDRTVGASKQPLAGRHQTRAEKHPGFSGCARCGSAGGSVIHFEVGPGMNPLIPVSPPLAPEPTSFHLTCAAWIRLDVYA
jgi:hypothetical protein